MKTKSLTLVIVSLLAMLCCSCTSTFRHDYKASSGQHVSIDGTASFGLAGSMYSSAAEFKKPPMRFETALKEVDKRLWSCNIDFKSKIPAEDQDNVRALLLAGGWDGRLADTIPENWFSQTELDAMRNGETTGFVVKHRVGPGLWQNVSKGGASGAASAVARPEASSSSTGAVSSSSSNATSNPVP